MNNKTVYINKIELHNHCTRHAFTANNKVDAAIFYDFAKKADCIQTCSVRDFIWEVEAIVNFYFDFFIV